MAARTASAMAARTASTMAGVATIRLRPAFVVVTAVEATTATTPPPTPAALGVNYARNRAMKSLTADTGLTKTLYLMHVMQPLPSGSKEEVMVRQSGMRTPALRTMSQTS